MKSRFFRILSLGTLGTLLMASSALACGNDKTTAESEAPAPTKPAVTVAFTTLQVDGVSCGSFLAPVRKELEALKGVQEIESGTDIKEVIVSYKPGSVSEQQLIDAVKKAGYEAVVKGAAPPAKS